MKSSPHLTFIRSYQASGGGAYLVVPLSHTGKLPDLYPLCRAHTAPVLDTSFSPFSENLIASSGEDGKVVLTNVDEDRLSAALRIEKPEVNDLEPVQRLSGHVRKAGHVKWHPVAENVLASASLEVRIWDVEKATCAVELPQQPDMVGSMSFNWTGTLLATLVISSCIPSILQAWRLPLFKLTGKTWLGLPALARIKNSEFTI